MLGREQKRLIVRLSMFLMPIIAVKVAAIMLGTSHPRAVSAGIGLVETSGMVQPVSLLPASHAPQVTEQQEAAALRIHELTELGDFQSPFLHQQRPVVVGTYDDRAPIRVESTMPTFVVSAIMRAPSGNTALINGDLRQVGDEVEPGWYIHEIDDERRTVSLEHPVSGRTTRAQVQLPGRGN